MPKSIPKNKRWQLQDAKARFSQVVNETLDHGPQIITRHGKDVAALIPIADLPNVLAAHTSDDNRKGAILECLLRAPYPLAKLNLQRDQTPISPESIFED